MLTRDAMIVQSSHQNGAAEILLATKRAATAIVAATTLTTLPSHTFHAMLLSGGEDMVVMAWSKQARKVEKEGLSSKRLILGIPPTKSPHPFLTESPTLI